MATIPANRIPNNDNVIIATLPKEHHGGKMYIKTQYTPLESLVVKRSGNNILLILRIEYAFGTSRSDKNYFKATAKKYWEGTFGNYHVTLTIDEKINPASNLIHFTRDQMRYSHCAERRKDGGSGMEMFLFNLAPASEVAHEIGHLFHLEEGYVVTNNGRNSVPKAGYTDKNIMANAYTGLVEKKNIDDILSINPVQEDNGER